MRNFMLLASLILVTSCRTVGDGTSLSAGGGLGDRNGCKVTEEELEKMPKKERAEFALKNSSSLLKLVPEAAAPTLVAAQEGSKLTFDQAVDGETFGGEDNIESTLKCTNGCRGGLRSILSAEANIAVEAINGMSDAEALAMVEDLYESKKRDVSLESAENDGSSSELSLNVAEGLARKNPARFKPGRDGGFVTSALVASAALELSAAQANSQFINRITNASGGNNPQVAEALSFKSGIESNAAAGKTFEAAAMKASGNKPQAVAYHQAVALTNVAAQTYENNRFTEVKGKLDAAMRKGASEVSRQLGVSVPQNVTRENIPTLMEQMKKAEASYQKSGYLAELGKYKEKAREIRVRK